MTPTEIVLQCLKESGPLTVEALVFESDLDETTVMSCLLRLTKEGRVQRSNGTFKLFNKSLSDKIRMGKLVSSIPTLGGAR